MLGSTTHMLWSTTHMLGSITHMLRSITHVFSECSCSHPTLFPFLFSFLVCLCLRTHILHGSNPTLPLESTVDIILVLDSVHPHTYLVITIKDQALVRLHGAKAKTQTQSIIFRQGTGNRSCPTPLHQALFVGLGSTLVCLDVKCFLALFNHLLLLCRFMT